MRIALISDTHLPRRGGGLPGACRERLGGADLIIHAGDLCDMATLAAVRAIGPPVLAVHGNADDREVRAALPETAEAEAGALRIGLVHDAGPEAGRVRRLRRRFPRAGLVVFGHSHIPFLGEEDGFLAVNPGSPTDRRRQPRHTMAEVIVAEGPRPEVRFHAVDPPEGPLPPGLVRPGRG